MSQLWTPDQDLVDVAPLPACRYCGCTEIAACPEGCAWLEDFRDAGFYICDADECVAALEAETEAALGQRFYVGALVAAAIATPPELLAETAARYGAPR